MDPLIVAVLGFVQGVFEWIPVSSSGFVSLLGYVFGLDVGSAVNLALSLHLASGLAALVIVRGEAVRLLRGLMRGERVPCAYLLGVAVSLPIGFAVYKVFMSFTGDAWLVLLAMGVLLVATSILTHRPMGGGGRGAGPGDVFVAASLQGLSVLPGLSRSGFVLFILGLRGVNSDEAFRFNLLLAVPVLILAGAYGAAVSMASVSLPSLVWAEALAFLVSLAAGHLLLRFFSHLETWKFTLAVALLLIASSLIELISG